MILKRTYKLDVVAGGSPLIIRTSRNDSSSTLVFSLFAREGVLDIPSGATAAIRGKASGSASFSFVNGIPTIQLNLTKAMTGKAGMLPFELALTAGGHTFVTDTFYLDVR